MNDPEWQSVRVQITLTVNGVEYEIEAEPWFRDWPNGEREWDADGLTEYPPAPPIIQAKLLEELQQYCEANL